MRRFPSIVRMTCSLRRRQSGHGGCEVNLTGYRTLVFDCDGVILDSKKVKTSAFYNAALPYGKDMAEALVAYHKQHGGVSRYRKFETFLREIAQQSPTESALHSLLQRYAAEVR